MIDRRRRLRLPLHAAEAEHEEHTGSAFTALRLFAAEFFLAAGAAATLHYLRGGPAPEGDDDATEWHRENRFAEERRVPLAAALVPAVVGTLAGAGQAAQAFRPSPARRPMLQALNGGVVAIGAIGLADSIQGAARGQRRLSMLPLLFGYAGVLGLLVERQEERVREKEGELERRARIVERLVPRRRPKLDKIVVHV